MRDLDSDDSVGVIILTGRGRSFCSGVDLTAAEEVFKGDVRSDEANPVALMERCRKPIIGAVCGFAVTGGFEIALACDVLVASKDARFVDTHSRFSIHPTWGLSQKLSRIIGPNRAREISLTGKPITAEMAEKWGLANHIVERDEVLNKAKEIAEAILKNNRDMVLKYKEVLDREEMEPLPRQLLLALPLLLLLLHRPEAAQQAFRRDPGHAQWHHGAFHDVQDGIRNDIRHMLHSRAEVPFQVPLEINIVLVGFNSDGGYRFSLDAHKLEEFLRTSFPTHRPSCHERGEPIDIEHHFIYNVYPAGQPELIALEKALRESMVPTGTARESEYGRELPLYEVEATTVEPMFQTLYSYIFDFEGTGSSATEMDRPLPTVIFVLNFDKVRMDPRNKDVDLDSLMYGKINGLTDKELSAQEADYIYRYRYRGGGASQVWLSSGRFVVIDLSAGPCTYGKIETEEGSISSLISTTIEHVIAPDLRFETVDLTSRLLVPIIVLQNHNRYNILQAGHNYSIDVQAIEKEVKKMVHAGQEVVIVGGSHALHRHEKLAIAVSKATRSHSLHETKKDGRFHVHTKTYLDGAVLKEEMERSADVLAAGLLDISDPSLSSKFYLRQHWMDESDGSQDSIIKHRPLWAAYNTKRVDTNLLMDDESLVWTSKDVVIVLQHDTEKIPLSYVSETDRMHAYPLLAQRHILAGLASAVGGLSAPYEKVSHIHERPISSWLWAMGCHPFGPFSNSSETSQLLQDVALRSNIYARVDSALRKIRDSSEKLEEQLVDLSSLLYDHRIEAAYLNSSEILQSTIYTQLVN
ncbi:hypothetical protein QJS10_CPA16g01682 [Acorus calamus]|uniref:DUF7906 domain-containing protein n=1 Tax=Acorus calamus TaxID=4465 RepID=A0AAV9D2M3_ACOCL|nr:hypothetical protein QJS10_CPA16g01682 [Acorus calamus]